MGAGQASNTMILNNFLAIADRFGLSQSQVKDALGPISGRKLCDLLQECLVGS